MYVIVKSYLNICYRVSSYLDVCYKVSSYLDVSYRVSSLRLSSEMASPVANRNSRPRPRPRPRPRDGINSASPLWAEQSRRVGTVFVLEIAAVPSARHSSSSVVATKQRRAESSVGRLKSAQRWSKRVYAFSFGGFCTLPSPKCSNGSSQKSQGSIARSDFFIRTLLIGYRIYLPDLQSNCRCSVSA